MTRTTTPQARPSAALASVCLALMAVAGCTQEASTTLLSPVQAVTTLLQQPDGRVEAELVLISTAVTPHQFVGTADNARIRVPGGALVGLARTGSGHYTMDSTQNAELDYQPGEVYRFSFDLNDNAAQQVAGGNFVAVMTAPVGSASFTIARAPAFAGDTATVTWTPANRYALIEVRDAAGATVYENFDFAQPQFDGSKWARLRTNGMDTLGVDVFRQPGDYTLHLCAVNLTSGFDPNLSAELGVLSGFLIGDCAAPQSLTVAP